MKWCLDKFALNIPGVCMYYFYTFKIKQILTVVISRLCNYGVTSLFLQTLLYFLSFLWWSTKKIRGEGSKIYLEKSDQRSYLYIRNCSTNYINLETVPFKGQFTFRLISWVVADALNCGWWNRLLTAQRMIHAAAFLPKSPALGPRDFLMPPMGLNRSILG